MVGELALLDDLEGVHDPEDKLVVKLVIVEKSLHELWFFTYAMAFLVNLNQPVECYLLFGRHVLEYLFEGLLFFGVVLDDGGSGVLLGLLHTFEIIIVT